MRFNGKLKERLREAWIEIRQNLGRSVLQAIGVTLGVASVLGGFSITDSQRRRSDELFVKIGGLDKLNVQPTATALDSNPTALQAANLGLRGEDAQDGGKISEKDVHGVSLRRFAQARIRSPFADEERRVTGAGGDFFPLEGYEIEKGRLFSSHDVESAAAVVVIGSEAARTFFPDGNALGQTLRIGDTPVVVIGVLSEKVFRFREGQRNMFRWRNRIVAVPSTLVQRRMQGDAYHRLDRVTFRIPDLSTMSDFASKLTATVRANHRQQQDFRLDDVAARIRRMRSQGNVYNVIFMLSGFLSLIGGGIVNVNIQMASLKDRVREVGVKMALGASPSEVFKSFLTEALLLTGLGSLAGLIAGVALSKMITSSLKVPLYMDAKSFAAAFFLATAFGFVFALFPAWKASRLSPMEALRYE
jgi:ABC-type antimicrobial peptide transport system permease subunit